MLGVTSLALADLTEEDELLPLSEVVCKERLGGLLREYTRRLIVGFSFRPSQKPTITVCADGQISRILSLEVVLNISFCLLGIGQGVASNPLPSPFVH